MIVPDMQALIDALRSDGTKVGTDAAALIEWLINERADLVTAYSDEREHGDRMAQQVNEMAARLNRIGDHLRTLTIYAEGDNDHAPPCDPWPESEAPAKLKRRARNG